MAPAPLHLTEPPPALTGRSREGSFSRHWRPGLRSLGWGWDVLLGRTAAAEMAPPVLSRGAWLWPCLSGVSAPPTISGCLCPQSQDFRVLRDGCCIIQVWPWGGASTVCTHPAVWTWSHCTVFLEKHQSSGSGREILVLEHRVRKQLQNVHLRGAGHPSGRAALAPASARGGRGQAGGAAAHAHPPSACP